MVKRKADQGHFKSDEFVESDSDSAVKNEDAEYSTKKEESADEEKPKKKVKKEKVKKEEPVASTSALSQNVPADGLERNEEGDQFADLGKLKRCTVRSYKKHTLVDLREYYVDKESQQKPGKKGLSLTVDQWKKLCENKSAIDAAIAQLEG